MSFIPTQQTTTEYTELVKAPTAAEKEATYQAALKLVARIDEDLARGIRHYRDQAGILLTTLDEVVRAILADNLLLPGEEGPNIGPELARRGEVLPAFSRILIPAAEAAQ